MQSIYHYISYTLFNDLAAYHLDGVINDKFDLMEDYPEIGSRINSSLDDIANEFHDVRKITANNYLMLYTYFTEFSVVIVSHIFHQTQDYGRIFQN